MCLWSVQSVLYPFLQIGKIRSVSHFRRLYFIWDRFNLFMGLTMYFLHFVDRAFRYISLLKTNLTHFFIHVSSITVLIIRRSNCINSSSGMISLCSHTTVLTQTVHQQATTNSRRDLQYHVVHVYSVSSWRWTFKSRNM